MVVETSDSGSIVVTGANAGIGKAAALQLAREGRNVVVVSRNAAKGRQAVDEIRCATGNENVKLVHGDVSSIRSTRQLAEALLIECPRIDALINNAGVWMTERVLNEDGLEMTFMVNHLAPFMLSNLLLDRLKASAPARIVNVNAGLYVKGEADLDRLPKGENFNRFKTYMHSKLCNVLFTLELARRLEGTGVTVNALHPGVIRTQLGDTKGAIGLLLKVVKRFWATPEDGAKPVVRLALEPALEGVSGKYFNEFEEIPIVPNAQDPELAFNLWHLSARLTGCGE